MIINTNIAIAFRGIYGNFNFNEITLFDLGNVNGQIKNFKMLKNNKEVVITTKCPVCSKYHCYKYSLSELRSKSLIIGGCEEIGIPVFFIGKSSNVKQRISSYNKINKEILAMI